MTKMVKLFAALLIVFSAATANAKVDSVSLASYCKVISTGEDKHFRVLYQSPGTTDVEVQILDRKQNLIFSDRIGETEGFVKVYDMSRFADGVYSFQVLSDELEYEQVVNISQSVNLVEEWNAGKLHFTAINGNVALVGTNDSAGNVVLVIEDGEGHTLRREVIGPGEVVKNLYNLERIDSDEVKIYIYRKMKIAKETIVKL